MVRTVENCHEFTVAKEAVLTDLQPLQACCRLSRPPAEGRFPSQGLTQLLWVHRELIAGVPPEAEMPALSPHGWGSALIPHGCLSPGRERTGGNVAASLFHFPFFPRTGPRRSRQ